MSVQTTRHEAMASGVSCCASKPLKTSTDVALNETSAFAISVDQNEAEAAKAHLPHVP